MGKKFTEVDTEKYYNTVEIQYKIPFKDYLMDKNNDSSAIT